MLGLGALNLKQKVFVASTRLGLVMWTHFASRCRTAGYCCFLQAVMVRGFGLVSISTKYLRELACCCLFLNPTRPHSALDGTSPLARIISWENPAFEPDDEAPKIPPFRDQGLVRVWGLGLFGV